MANSIGTAAEAVDYIRSVIEPNEELHPYICNPELCYTPGESCGCKVENKNIIHFLGPSVYRTERNYNDDALIDKIDIGYLLEGDCYDRLCASKNIEDCIINIADSAYNVRPFEKFYLCLRDHWEDFNEDISTGFSPQMKMVIMRDERTGYVFRSNKDGVFSK